MTPNRTRSIVLAALLAAVGVAAVPADAAAQQRGRAGQGPPDRQEMQRRIQARFGEIVRRQLGLDEARQEALLRAIRASEEQRRELARREMELRLRLRDQASLAPRSGPSPLVPDGEARQVLEEMRAIQQAEARLFVEEQERLLEVLTPPQLVRFYALREALAQRVRRLRQGPPGPGGPPWTGPPGR